MYTLIPLIVLVGSLSSYWPGDGFNAGEKACGGKLTWASNHIAIRQWKGLCGAKVYICAAHTGVCVWTTVQDSGPFGCVNKKGKWRNCVRGKQKDETWRAVVDLSPKLWKLLGKPRFLSQVHILIYQKKSLGYI